MARKKGPKSGLKNGPSLLNCHATQIPGLDDEVDTGDLPKKISMSSVSKNSFNKVQA